MRVPLSWLREFVAIDLPVEELARRLTFGGMEVAQIHRIGVEGSPLPWDPELIVVANVLEVRSHPNADRLVLADVDYGAAQPHTVVTGAPNLFPYRDQGRLPHPLKAVFAREGAQLYDGHAEGWVITKLKGRPVRGVMSDAMLCSEKELGLSEDHEGILILPDDAPVGMPLRDYLGEVILEIDLTPNFARCLSIVGIAREVAALTGAPLKLPDPQVVAEGPSIIGRAKVTVHEPDLCPRFMVGLAEGVKIGPSPFWMQRRLINAGMRPINNIVDISNYVMLEWGQPTHAFDADRVADRHLIVRLAQPGERLTTLDDRDRDLTPSPESGLSHPPLLVCDATGPLAIAGVMGGASSEVSNATTNVLLEAAIWEPVQIRRTARSLKLPSEASRRFERGVDYALPPIALRRCLELMRLYAGATIAADFIDVYSRPWQPVTIELPPSEVRRLLGIHLDAHSIAEILGRLGFTCSIQGGSTVGDFAILAAEPVVRVEVPSFRQDVTMVADLCEELARVYGYDRIPSTRLADELPPPMTVKAIELEDQVRDLMVGAGLTELITYSLIDMALVARVQPSEAVPERYLKISNPGTPEHVYMRRSLLPSLAAALALNLRERERSLVFEIGRVYLPPAEPGKDERWLPDEPRRLAIALAGPRQPESWLSTDRDWLDFYDLKGIVELLGERLGLSDQLTFAPLTDDERFHPGRSAVLMLVHKRDSRGRPVDQQPVGVLGEAHPQVRARLEVNVPRVLLAEIDLETLIAHAGQATYRAISRFPASVQDLSIVADETVSEAQIRAVIQRSAGEYLESLTLFDRYSGSQVEEGKRSLTYHLVFRASDRTLLDETLAKIRKKIIGNLERELGATIRS
ncbi:phenylalanine--tRNA ligase subunit beta [Chloroflexus aggregans]|uniref:Phenylalanine--tRNA ligase beta subunit n=1 Tax=Chloroflexus aggregans (strain MD-66 / DSM 9485) TaxID=326427 RepID=B8G3T2_CHLAD|nr:phenylalanine--tRNA ligase subunit beta [Chloroflexus aggregans]ACL25334.1 phenylalanyl-tRNA synthetase, beta subunit [Chloroflexus aggregans DSM 9485]